MRIVCPNCEAAYAVPESVVQARRTLRCARCSADFLPGAEAGGAPELAPAAVTAPPAAPPSSHVPPRVPPRVPVEAAAQEADPGGVRPDTMETDRLARLTLAALEAEPRGASPVLVGASWAVSLLLLAGLGWAAIAWRGTVMQAWPPSTRIYAALGYPT